MPLGINISLERSSNDGDEANYSAISFNGRATPSIILESKPGPHSTDRRLCDLSTLSPTRRPFVSS